MPLFLEGAQAKRKVGQPGDIFEQHADKIADAAAHGTGLSSQQELPHLSNPTLDAEIPAADSGSPLDSQVRERVEPVLGADLSDVRVHQTADDREVARALGARAFTHDQQIWMGPEASSSDVKLMAHEAAHVAQQAAAPSAPSVQRQPTTTTTATGTPNDMVAFVNQPQVEKDASLKTALAMLNRYSPTVDISKVSFRIMTAVQSYVGRDLSEEGRSHWEGSTPVIELTQEKYDTVAQHAAGTAAISDVHELVRTVGHEMYHLYRERTGNQSNPIKPLYEAEATKRMDKIRQNWVDFAKDPGGHKILGIAPGQPVTKWEDIPETERKKIEAGATATSEIQGLYEQTAYLVEEIYVRIEELSWLRVQQQAETGPKKPSAASVTEIAKLIGRFSTALDNSVGTADFMTPDLLTRTRAAMLEYLRKRYPHSADPSKDSYEVIFYLTAIRSGMPPIYSDGQLISVAPPGARVP